MKELFATAKLKSRKYSSLGFATTKAIARCSEEVRHGEGQGSP